MSLETPLPSLRLLSEQVLRHNWIHVRDVGDCPYEVVSNVLKLSSAPQLFEIEENSPHLNPHTNEIWKQLCVNDFVEIRKLVEDGKLDHPEEERASWKMRYQLEEEKKQVKMKLVLEKLRGQYSELDEKKQSRQVQSIDGLRLEKRRKLLGGASSSSTRPKSLLEKARHNTKAITSIYAPKRKAVQAPSARKVSALVSAFPSSRRPVPKSPIALPAPRSSQASVGSPPPPSMQTSRAPNKSPEVAIGKRPIVKTVTRTATTTKRSSALMTGGSPSSGNTRQNSFSPPPSSASTLSATSSSFVVPPARPIAQVPLRSKMISPATVSASPASAVVSGTLTKDRSATHSSSSGPPSQIVQCLDQSSSSSSSRTLPAPRRPPVAATGGLFIPKKQR